MLISPMPSPPSTAKKSDSSTAATATKSTPPSTLNDLLVRPSATEGLPAFLKKKIAFREATHSESLRGLVKIDASTSSYTSYSASASSGSNAAAANASRKRRLEQDDGPEPSTASARDEKYGFTPATVDLFPRARLAPFLKWTKIRPVGPGLTNLGNTCFLNSVLQCLIYTAPLAEFLLAREHSRRCSVPKEEFCGLCALEQLIQRVFVTREPAIRPLEVVGRLKAIGKQFRPGRQEDAHEFLRLLVESLQKAALPPPPSPASQLPPLDHRSRETSLIHRIFGGYLQSTVTCASCRHVSRTFEAFLDLSLDVKQADSLQAALRLFTAPETLSKSNRYRCESCRRLTEAQKKFSVYSAPQILTVQLKRFFVHPMTGQPGKLNRPIAFPEHFDLASCMSDTDHGQSTAYKLTGVIVHEGSTCQSGHYHAFIKAPAGVWYSMNDCSVSRVGIDVVLRQRAYILFYERIDGSPSTRRDQTDDGVAANASAADSPSTRTANPTSRQERLAEAISLGRSTSVASSAAAVASDDDVPELVAVKSSIAVSTSMWHVSLLPRPTATQLPQQQKQQQSGINHRAKHLIDNNWQVEPLQRKQKK